MFKASCGCMWSDGTHERYVLTAQTVWLEQCAAEAAAAAAAPTAAAAAAPTPGLMAKRGGGGCIRSRSRSRHPSGRSSAPEPEVK
jgi:hypothetical protein